MHSKMQLSRLLRSMLKSMMVSFKIKKKGTDKVKKEERAPADKTRENKAKNLGTRSNKVVVEPMKKMKLTSKTKMIRKSLQRVFKP